MSYTDYCGICGESYDDENLETCRSCGRSFCYHCGDFREKRCKQCGEDEKIPAESTSGCEICWPADAQNAWEARRTLNCIHELVSDSHFYVSILECAHCRQQFISVFTEMIDWEKGDDAQYWTVMPLTHTEVASLVEQGDSLSEAALNSLSSERKSLYHDHPTGKAARTSWGRGLHVGPHD